MQFVAKRHILSFLCLTVDIICMALVLFTGSLTNPSPDGVGTLHKLLTDEDGGWGVGGGSVSSNESGAGGLRGL